MQVSASCHDPVRSIMRRVSCVFLVLAVSCASKPKAPPPTKQELWLPSERAAIRNAWRPSLRMRLEVADTSIERLDELLQENFDNTKGAWCMVLLGEWFLVKSEIHGDDDEREVAAAYFKSVMHVMQMLNDLRGRSAEAEREKDAIAAAANDGLKRAKAGPRPSNEEQRWLQSQQAAIQSALRLEPKRARKEIADDAIEHLDELLGERYENLTVGYEWCMVLAGEWYLVRATATRDTADRKVAVDYFENVIALGDAWPEVAAILAAKDGLKRAQAKG